MAKELEWKFEPVASCPVCGETQTTVRLERQVREVPLRFVACSRCGLLFQNPRPSRETLERYFSSTAFIKDERDEVDLNDTLGYYNYFNWDTSYRKTARLRLRWVRRFVPPPAKLLEVGTATGSFLAEAKHAGYDVRGLDLSTLFATYARSQNGLVIDNGFIEDFPLPPSAYDVVCYFGGIACSYDPLKALKNIRRALKPAGIFIFNATRIDTLVGLLTRDHFPEYNHASLVVHTRRSIQELLSRTGFDVVQAGVEWQVASLERVVTYLRSNGAWGFIRRLGLGRINLPVLAVGTYLYICRSSPSLLDNPET